MPEHGPSSDMSGEHALPPEGSDAHVTSEMLQQHLDQLGSWYGRNLREGIGAVKGDLTDRLHAGMSLDGAIKELHSGYAPDSPAAQVLDYLAGVDWQNPARSLENYHPPVNHAETPIGYAVPLEASAGLETPPLPHAAHVHEAPGEFVTEYDDPLWRSARDDERARADWADDVRHSLDDIPDLHDPGPDYGPTDWPAPPRGDWPPPRLDRDRGPGPGEAYYVVDEPLPPLTGEEFRALGGEERSPRWKWFVRGGKRGKPTGKSMDLPPVSSPVTPPWESDEYPPLASPPYDAGLPPVASPVSPPWEPGDVASPPREAKASHSEPRPYRWGAESAYRPADPVRPFGAAGESLPHPDSNEAKPRLLSPSELKDFFASQLDTVTGPDLDPQYQRIYRRTVRGLGNIYGRPLAGDNDTVMRGDLEQYLKRMEELKQTSHIDSETRQVIEIKMRLIAKLLDPDRARQEVQEWRQRRERETARTQDHAQTGRDEVSSEATEERPQGNVEAESGPEPPPPPKPDPESEPAPRPERRAPQTEAELQAERQRMAEAVSEAAKGSVVIHTDLPNDQPIRLGGREILNPHVGFSTFGDGYSGEKMWKALPLHLHGEIGPYNQIWDEKGEYAKDVVEAFSFTHAETTTEPKPVERVERTGPFGWGKKKKIEKEEIPSEPIMIIDPATGKEEQAVYFDYCYAPGLNGSSTTTEDRLGLPPYKETIGSRTGNRLTIRTLLPPSVARQLQDQIHQDPTTIRTVVEELVLKNGGITRELWEQGDPRRKHPVRPPYDGLPDDWTLTELVFKPKGSEPREYSAGYVARKLEKPIEKPAA